MKGVGGAEQLGLWVDEGEPLPLDQMVRNHFAIISNQNGLAVEELKLGNSTCGENKNNVFGFGCKVRAGSDVGGEWFALSPHGLHRDRTQSNPHGRKSGPAGKGGLPEDLE